MVVVMVVRAVVVVVWRLLCQQQGCLNCSNWNILRHVDSVMQWSHTTPLSGLVQPQWPVLQAHGRSRSPNCLQARLVVVALHQ
jgi:hypothetical protein